MKTIVLLLPSRAVPSSITGVLDILSGTNQYFTETDRDAPFRIVLAGDKNLTGSVLIGPGVEQRTLAEIDHADLVMAPAFQGEPDEILQENAHLVQWIRQQYQAGAEVASLCFGSYFLAEAGILNGKICTSHWMAAKDMQRRYPDIKMMPDVVLTDQEGVYTSGGAFSSLNLVLYLVEKFCGKDVGVWVSKMFSIDISRVKQAHFAVFRGQYQHHDEAIHEAQTYIEQNYDKQISVEQVAGQSNMSKRNFIRRFKSATQNTPLEYLQRVKIEAAKKALEHSAQDTVTLAYDAGYNDVKTFRMVFKRITGLTPQDYRRKYCRAV
ncbi:GlxA family transcriptional regulator [Deminuibacter soli]|uniref:Helix-turn-helix domain-containing protein n=1 Tax=Deminuibacter soli TaxID=2291815 RepID=A0A3E1NCV1_9BACT|nr:helix-turn-helix domain-containing protein [Deminuibacter soli]RFM25644.1 helix-turn-helix domain-containing protein [Deminuibacter soli]